MKQTNIRVTCKLLMKVVYVDHDVII